MHVNVGPTHAPRQEDGVYVGDISKQVTVGVHQTQLGVVFFAFLVVVARSVHNDRFGVRIEAEIRPNDDTRVVQIVSLDCMNRANLIY